MKTLQKVVLACFLGGFIGTLVAMQLNAFWWVGMFIGGFVGYLSYEFKVVIRAFKNAWTSVTNWKPRKLYWKMFLAEFIALLSICSTIAMGFSLFFCLLMKGARLLPQFMFMNGASLMVGFFIAIMMSFEQLFGKPEKADQKTIEENKKMAKTMNPAYVYLFLVPKYILVIIAFLIPKIVFLLYRAPGFIWKLTKHTFIEIHSDIRLLCGIDAAMGAVIGYFAGNALIGGVAGALIGGLNYEIVSKRILRLVPARAEK